MHVIKKTGRILLVLFTGLVLYLIVWWFKPEQTPRINSGEKNSIASIEYMNIGNVEQCVLIRTEDITNPVLLFLHGGPGMPMMYMAHEFQYPLEKYFTVVQWDRRGAGKTYARNVPSRSSMNIQQLLDDAYSLTDTLRNRFNKEKIFLAGHSFGTYLGSIMVHEHPELFHAYVSIGQVVDDDKARVLQESFIRQQAKSTGRTDVTKALNKGENRNLEDWLFEFGGELKNHKSFFPLLWTGLKAPEYSLSEVLKVAEASAYSSASMKYNVLNKSIYHEIRDYKIPIYFFVGCSDYTTPHALITEYYNIIEAPKKNIYYFENSAHFPFIEEPEKFSEVMKGLLCHMK